MGVPVLLNINGIEKKSVDVTYEDLLWLYRDFEKRNGKLPTGHDLLSKNNLPQERIVARVLRENNKTNSDFMLELGKVSHVRCEPKDYNLYLQRFINKCKELNRTLKINELVNNEYSLPSAKYFVDHCPGKNVKTYNDFLIWCGLEVNSKYRKEYISNFLIEYEKKLGRPIIINDISEEKTGFSMIVLTRLFGGLGNAKKEIGLMKTLPVQPKPFEFYKERLTKTLFAIKEATGRTTVSWADIESKKYNEFPTEHKTYTRAFKRNSVDINEYMKSLGFQLSTNKYSFHSTLNSGEYVMSLLEYDFTKFINEDLNLHYNINYKRNVLYKTFSNIDKRIDCDYVFEINGRKLYVEIAGRIYRLAHDDWHTYKYHSKHENDYRDNMILKENLLIENDCDYLFFMSNDIQTEKYKQILIDKINEMKEAIL